MSVTVQKEIAKQKQRGRERVKQTAEVFTPMDLCLRMVKEIPLEKLQDPDAKFLDNSCGDGNFLVALFKVLSKYGIGVDKIDVKSCTEFGIPLLFDELEGQVQDACPPSAAFAAVVHVTRRHDQSCRREPGAAHAGADGSGSW